MCSNDKCIYSKAIIDDILAFAREDNSHSKTGIERPTKDYTN